MQITHEQARKLSQFEADKVLGFEQKAQLVEHLKHCSDCRAYVAETKEVEQLAASAMKNQWSAIPVPHSVDILSLGGHGKTNTSKLLAIRTAIIWVVLLLFIFSASQFILSDPYVSDHQPVAVLPIPTPSMQSTSTKPAWENCELTSYTVQENETLAGIAHRFSISKEEIITLNKMTTDTIVPAMRLLVPICSSTPTGTAADPTLFATTYTPVIGSTTYTYTPDG